MQSRRKLTFQIYLRHSLKYKGLVWLAIFSIVIASLGNIIIPLFYRDFFNILSATGDLALKVRSLVDILIKVLEVNLVVWILWRTATFAAARYQARTEEDLYNSCFAYLHKHSVAFFNNNFVGSLVKKVNRFTDSFVGLTDIFFWDILGLVVVLVMAIVVLLQRNIWLGLGLLLWALVYMVISYFYSLYKLKYDIRKATLSSQMTGILADTATNQMNVKLFNGHQREIKYFGQVNNQYHNLRLFTWNLDNIFEAVQALLMITLEIGIFYLAIILWQRGIITLGDFVLIQAYVLGIMQRLWHSARIVRRYYEYMANAEEMTEIFDTPHEIQDSRSAKPLLIKQGLIEFKDVSFSYRQTREVISKFNLSIKPLEKIALIGPSGSGKSTIVSLLLRNFDLSKGKVLIDGQKISAVTLDSLWRSISMVNQDPILFHRTLKENIRYGKPESTDEEIYAAARLARAHDFILSFPEGYETYVGERGVRLSGGERQRVAIARAILKNAPILVLDEATSSLDSESEQLIQEALANLMKNKTVIVIAHRLSTIMKMDRIIVLDQGKIVEEGSHQELTKKSKGLYRRLWEKQAGGFIQ